MEEIFSVLGSEKQDIERKISEINNFLYENPNYEVKSVTGITKASPFVNGSFTGAIIVLTERKNK